VNPNADATALDATALDATALDELLALAERLARETGTMLVDRRPDDLGVAATKSSPTDIVTEMDTAAETFIVSELRRHRPDDGVLGEEGASDAGTSGVRWVIDPIDGTVNYLYRWPAWAVSIAAEVDGEVAVGVVHVPALGETYTAVRGGGARCNGRPLRVSAASALELALVGTGFGYERSRRAHQAQVLTAVLPRVRDVRRGGAASVDLCFVAAGRLDGYFERGLQPWDLAAGGLVAAEAGAVVGGLAGRAAGPDLVIAAAPGLFGELAGLLEPLGADRDD
jgi:myo-inositol-1(or 4)-monophosphatase